MVCGVGQIDQAIRYRQVLLGEVGIQTENSERWRHDMKEFAAYLLMALVSFFRSFERSRSEAGRALSIADSQSHPPSASW